MTDRQYPTEMSECGLKYDPFFSIRGLAVDKETGKRCVGLVCVSFYCLHSQWICIANCRRTLNNKHTGWITHLSYTHKVAVAWEGREKLPTSRIFEEYRGKRALTPAERRKRLKPLNDIFSMAECCLIADTIQFFKDRDIPYCAQNVVTDVLKAVTDTHLSGEFHRLVAQNPEAYFDPTPHLKDVLQSLKDAGKRLIFVSNSPFWYVDAGMRYGTYFFPFFFHGVGCPETGDVTVFILLHAVHSPSLTVGRNVCNVAYSFRKWLDSKVGRDHHK
jgi:5' nucleotidase family